MLDVIRPTEREKAARCLILEYNCVQNKYTRPNNGNEAVSGWEQLATSAVGVFRYDENPDHKKCYLSRKPGVPVGYISWRIDLGGVRVKRMEVNLGQLTTFHSGQIQATACYGDKCVRITGPLVVEERDAQKCESLEIRVEFSGGDGRDAWQHSQLFRSDTEDPWHSWSGRCTNSMNIRVSW